MSLISRKKKIRNNKNVTNLSLLWDHNDYYSTKFLLFVSHAQPKHVFFQWQFEIVHVPEIILIKDE